MSRYTVAVLTLIGLLSVLWWAARAALRPYPDFVVVLWSYRAVRVAFGAGLTLIALDLVRLNRVGREIEANKREWLRQNADPPDPGAEEVRYEVAAAAAREALSVTQDVYPSGKAERFGRLLFLFLDSFREVERRLQSQLSDGK